MKPTYVQAIIEENDNLKLEIAELRQALTGRTVSCHACNQSAMERDMLRENIHEALEEIDELKKDMQIRNCIACNSFQFGSGWCDRHKALGEEREAIKDIKFKAVDDGTV